jgi:thiol-disulfide isomerase/thioredoxin
MKNIFLTAGLALACAASASAQDDHATAWYADFDQAAAVAKEQGKDLFVDFTGSDWCGWCIKLHDEVFQYESFLAPVQERFVLVALDFPNGEEAKAKVPNPERNQELSEKYGIMGFPTCLLMTADGVVYGRMGYQEGGPEKYVEDMKALTTKGKKLLADLKQLKKDYQAAEDKTPVLEKAIAMLEGMDSESPGITIVADMVMQAVKADADGKKGMKLKAVKALLASGQANEEIFAAARKMDPKNEKGLLEKVVLAKFSTVRDEESALAAIAEIEALLALGTYHDATEVKQMATMAAIWCNGPLENTERAAKIAAQAKAIEAEIDPRMQGELDKIGA